MAGSMLAFGQTAAVPTTADVKSTTDRFIRFVDEGASGGKLQASEITFQNDSGVTVRLVSAVHVGERSYYEALEREFAKDDVVLYEMVKAKGAAPPRKGDLRQADHPVAMLQQFLQKTLDLHYQLEEIDYRRPNFVHADLDAETFIRLQNARNESMASLMMKSMSDALSRPQAGAGTGDGAADLLSLIATPDPTRQARLRLARQMKDVEAIAAGIDGPNGSVILTERNRAAMRVLNQQIRAGKKRISIFYGAAHMPDMARRIEEMGFAPVDTTWHTAWDATVRKDQPSLLQKWFPPPATQPAKGQ